MTEYSKFPAYVDFESHSIWGVHHMQLKTTEWTEPSAGHDLGEFVKWSGGNVDAEAMIDAMAAKLVPFFKADYNIDSATIYTLDAVGAPAIPRVGKTLALVGSSTQTTQTKATQHTWTFRDTGWHVARIVLLDSPVNADFEPIVIITGVTAAEDLVAEFTADANGWASPADLRPATFRKIVYTLNDGLRRKYGMT